MKTQKKQIKKPTKDPIPKGWEWVSYIVEEAHLPALGLPVKWTVVEDKYAKIAFDPKKNQTIDISTNKITSHKKGSPVGFPLSTKGKNPMPGIQTPASVRYARYVIWNPAYMIKLSKMLQEICLFLVLLMVIM